MISQVVCLAGFGDPVVSERWVAELALAVGDKIEVTAVDWPGLWTRFDQPVSFTRLLDEVTDLTDEKTVLVGHSLGGRVALQVASHHPTAAVAALCSPRHSNLTTEQNLHKVQDMGGRLTHRLAVNSMPVSFTLPVSFFEEVTSSLGEATIPDVPTLLVFGANDGKVSSSAWPASGGLLQVQEVADCTHRFMDDVKSRQAVVELVAEFISQIAESSNN